jgi:cation diffusion facilitator family transporter
MAGSSSKRSTYAALAGNILVALTKAAAAVWTGSSAMVSEAIHSIVDTSNEMLLLYGYHRASRPPDQLHPLGYGRELYFWSFIVALLIFALGAGISFYQGVQHVLDPQPIMTPWVSYIVLGLSFVFEGSSWIIALRGLRASGQQGGYYEAFVRSKDPPAYIVLFEDSAALIGIVIAASAIGASVAFNQPIWDGVGSILIGLLLAMTSIVLARESKSLLIGEPAHSELTKSILAIAEKTPGVLRANGVLTVHMSPSQVVAAISVEFADDKRADEIEQSVVSIEDEVLKEYPGVAALFIKPQTGTRYRQSRQRRLGRSGG